MDAYRIARTLSAAESAVAAKEPVGPTGFWRAVAAVKRDPVLADGFADRIAEIDSAAFKKWSLLRIPVRVGTSLAVVAVAAGFWMIGLTYSLSNWEAGFVFLGGWLVLALSTHGLAHLTVGTLMGMRFTHWFVGTWRLPQPGVKVDYSTYLRTPARQRAWMHASGAIVTKILPFALLGGAFAADIPIWAIAALIMIGLNQLVTDYVWSTKSLDWKKFKREMRFAQES